MTVSNVSRLDLYASFSRIAYDNEGIFIPADFPGYIQIHEAIDYPLGFQARAFFNVLTDELVIAFAGTEGFDDFNPSEFIPDLFTDASLALAGIAPQVSIGSTFITDAVAFASGLSPTFDIIYTGHSLGGFLAQAA